VNAAATQVNGVTSSGPCFTRSYSLIHRDRSLARAAPPYNLPGTRLRCCTGDGAAGPFARTSLPVSRCCWPLPVRHGAPLPSALLAWCGGREATTSARAGDGLGYDDLSML
jgi:hypothetical protein